MRTGPIGTAELARTVLAVPPLALDARRRIRFEECRKLVARCEAAGVRAVLWGGNAQLAHWPVSRLGELFEMAEETAGPETIVVPSIGPDWGKLVDGARALAATAFACAMALPMPGPTTSEGVATALREAAERAGKPLLAYIREPLYLEPEALARLVAQGVVLAVKYGVPPPGLGRDGFLDDLLAAIGRERLISGAGELLALRHVPDYGLAGFTSGSVCLAPRRSMRILAALRRGEREEAERLAQPIAAFEALRERWGAVRVLHEAVRLAGIAETGPVLPMLGPCPAASLAEIEAVARALVAAEAELDPARADATSNET